MPVLRGGINPGNCDRCGIYTNFLHIGRDGQSPHAPSLLLCPDCQRERVEVFEQVDRHNRRARKLGVLATLSQEQWWKARWHFHHQCVYCGYQCSRRGEIYLDHFIPLGLGGGTASNNCVPACRECNARKSDTHPDLLDWVSKDRIMQIRLYLMRTEANRFNCSKDTQC